MFKCLRRGRRNCSDKFPADSMFYRIMCAKPSDCSYYGVSFLVREGDEVHDYVECDGG